MGFGLLIYLSLPFGYAGLPAGFGRQVLAAGRVLTNEPVALFEHHVLVSAAVPLCVADNDPHGMDGVSLQRVHRPRFEDREQGADSAPQVAHEIAVVMLSRGMTFVMAVLRHRVVLVILSRISAVVVVLFARERVRVRPLVRPMPRNLGQRVHQAQDLGGLVGMLRSGNGRGALLRGHWRASCSSCTCLPKATRLLKPAMQKPQT